MGNLVLAHDALGAVMLSFLRRDLPCVGRVLYPGAIPPPAGLLDSLRARGVSVKETSPPRDHVWAAEAQHAEWGSAEIVCARNPEPLPSALIDYTLSLTTAEKAEARTGASTIAVRTRARAGHVLADRKLLLRWLRELLRLDGVIAIDGNSSALWSPAMLDDELAHDADLDIEALYTIHALYHESDPERFYWMHTHGLEELGAFDVDILNPSPLFSRNPADPLRAVAFAALEQAIAIDTDRFELAHPGGSVRFVPVGRFHQLASSEDQALREQDEAHSGRRAVLCDPGGGLFARWRSQVKPSRFLSSLNTENVVFPFSTAATDLMAARARRTLRSFVALKGEFASLELPALIKIGYRVDGGGPNDREHLWFEVHDVRGDSAEATLVNTPFRVSDLQAGKRSKYSLEGLSDWTIMSPEGPMTPRNVSAARRLRETRTEWQTRIDEAKQQPR